MLMQLQIENVAVIEKQSIEFFDGFNVLTGETGAGKSIIIDSINAVTGERTSKDIIRTGAEKAKISATFCNIGKDAENILEESTGDVTEDGILFINREISKDGKSVFRLNGKIVPMMIIKQIAPFLINIHGQNDNQKLFSASEHLKFIDSFASLDEEISEYKQIYSKLTDIKNELDNIETDDVLKERKIELLTFQIDEIKLANLSSGEEEELLSRRDVIRNSEELAENVSNAHNLLSGGDEEDGAVNLIKRVASSISQIADFDEEFVALSERTSSIAFELEEILSEIRNADGRFEYNEQELDEIEERLDVIFKLKQKYGNTIDEILEKYSEFQQQLDNITFSDKRIEKLKEEYESTFKKAFSIAETISKRRIIASKLLCDKIQNELAFLDMPNVKFSVSHNTTDLKSDGIDQMEFLISANAGETLRPLSKIASGGELSRIMLAIKTVLSGEDQVNSMIFDEIDTGVSGKTARKIGEKMRQISYGKQVFCVTHLAQIASLANNHFLIEKNTSDGRTFTSVKKLDLNERINEVARIMGGDVLTPATLKAAKELIIDID